MTLQEAIHTRQRDNNINALQGIAAVLVIYSHAFPLSSGNAGELLKDLSGGAFSFGALAVAVFFILSGFLLTQSLQRRPAFLPYIKNRLIRIYPAMLVCSVVCILGGAFFTTLPTAAYFTHPDTWGYLWKNLLFLQKQEYLPGVFTANCYGTAVNGSLWTLFFQMLFYIVLGIVSVLGGIRRRWPILLLWVIDLLLFLGRGWVLQLPWISSHAQMAEQAMYLFLYFGAGALAAIYASHLSLKWTYLLGSLALTIPLFLLRQYELMMAIPGTYILLWLSYSIRLPKLTSLSKVSYGLYVFAFPVQQAVTAAHGGTMSPYLNFCIAFPITLGLAWGSWLLVEQPLLKLKK